MKATELMIGDWFLADGISKQCEWEDYQPEEFGYMIDKYEPIPLTEEMLFPYEDNDPNNDIPNSYIFGGLIGMIWDGQGLDCGITILHYVHELQHALRLCGLEELADNLKVV